MPVTFNITAHTLKSGIQICEILMDGKPVAVIYPEGENGVKIVSAHLKGAGVEKDNFERHVVLSDNVNTALPLPSIHMTFEPGKYAFEGGRLIRVKDGG